MIGLSQAFAVAQTSTFDMESYSSENGDAPQTTSPVKYSGVKLAPKQQVLAWLSISDRAMLFSTVDSCVRGRRSSFATTRRLLEDTLQTLVHRILGSFQ